MKTFTVEALKVHVGDTHDQMAAAASAAVAEWLRSVLADQSQARVIFASAASQVRFLDALRRESGVDWSRVVCYHMDE